MRHIDLATPYASAVIDGGSGLIGSDIFPSSDEYGHFEEYSHDDLGGMATASLVDIQEFFDSLSNDKKAEN